MKKNIIQMKGNDLSERVVEFILTRTNEELGELTVEKITGLLNVSRSHLYQRFKMEKKLTPGKYLLMMKILRSASLLAGNTRSPIEKIANKMGFSSADYFKKVFRAYFGTTPGRYRKYMKFKFNRWQILH